MSDSSQKHEDYATLRLQGSIRADSRLLLVCDHLLDEDIQPSIDDFSIVHAGVSYRVVAVQLESPWGEKPSCAAIILQTDQPLPKSAPLTVMYRPTQWMMWSQLHDQSVAPFEWNVEIDKTLAHVPAAGIPQLDAAEPDSPLADPAPPVTTGVSPATGSSAASKSTANKSAVNNAIPTVTARPEAGKSIMDRLLAMSVLLAVSAGGFLIVMLGYIAIQFFSASPFSSAPAASAPESTMCTVSLADGSRYEGQCANGIADGQGVQTATDGARYVGGWYNQHRHGKGMVTYPDGRTVSGTWRNGVPVGEFRLHWANGSDYVGTVDNEKPHGEGTMTYANGDSYKGGFDHDIKHGKGTMAWANGLRFEGEYKNDQPNGFGVFTGADGSRFEGMFVNGQMTQNGICYFPDGRSQRGTCP